jgi:hypothetical protein
MEGDRRCEFKRTPAQKQEVKLVVQWYCIALGGGQVGWGHKQPRNWVNLGVQLQVGVSSSYVMVLVIQEQTGRSFKGRNEAKGQDIGQFLAVGVWGGATQA